MKKIALLVAIACASLAHAQETPTTKRLLSEMSSAGFDADSISVVREAALRDSAVTLGARAGLRDKSCEIFSAVSKRQADLDKRFLFNALMMGPGLLPPVISEARNTVTGQRNLMRIATVSYQIDEPARLVDMPPTWRNWLYLGLDITACEKKDVVLAPDLPNQLRPQTDAERRFVKQELERAYAAASKQAQSIYDFNINQLERTYRGMRMYFALYERGLVSAPALLATTDVVTLEDQNTMILGDTVIRISKEAGFVDRPSEWKPLAF